MTGPDTTPPKDVTSADEVRLWLGDHSAGKGLRGRPSASAVDKAVGSLRKPSISFDGADDGVAGKPPRETTHRRGSLERERKRPLRAGEGPVGCVLCPSRELAKQTHEVVEFFMYGGRRGNHGVGARSFVACRDEGVTLWSK